MSVPSRCSSVKNDISSVPLRILLNTITTATASDSWCKTWLIPFEVLFQYFCSQLMTRCGEFSLPSPELKLVDSVLTRTFPRQFGSTQNSSWSRLPGVSPLMLPSPRKCTRLFISNDEPKLQNGCTKWTFKEKLNRGDWSQIWHTGERNKWKSDSLLGRSTVGGNLKHFNVLSTFVTSTCIFRTVLRNYFLEENNLHPPHPPPQL